MSFFSAFSLLLICLTISLFCIASVWAFRLKFKLLLRIVCLFCSTQFFFSFFLLCLSKYSSYGFYIVVIVAVAVVFVAIVALLNFLHLCHAALLLVYFFLLLSLKKKTNNSMLFIYLNLVVLTVFTYAFTCFNT